MKRLILLVALVMAMAVLAPAAFADDTDIDTDGAEVTEKDPSAAQEFKAQMLADYFTDVFDLKGDDEVMKDDVSALRAGGEDGHTIGWGALYKLMLFAGPEGFDPADFEGGWAIGQLRKIYLEDPEHDKADLRKNNLGQAQQASKDKPEKVMPSQANKDKQKHEG